jgi:hypothetical protein
MSRTNKFLLIILLIIAGIWIALLYFDSFDWNENYRSESKEPYGCFILTEMFRDTYGDEFNIISESEKFTPAEIDGPAAYIFIGDENYSDAIFQNKLLHFAGQGGDVFLSVVNIPAELKFLLNDTCATNETENDVSEELTDSTGNSITFTVFDSVTLALTDTLRDTATSSETKTVTDTIIYSVSESVKDTMIFSVRDSSKTEDESSVQEDEGEIAEGYEDSVLENILINHEYLTGIFDTAVKVKVILADSVQAIMNLESNYSEYAINKKWCYLDSCYDFTTDSGRILGFLNKSNVNFIERRYGRGRIFIHTTPIAFTNYFLSRPSSMFYLNAVFSRFQGKKIYYDEASHIPDYSFSPNGKSQSPFSFILKQKSLRWGWYTLILLVIIYIFFIARRKQRIIPVLAANRNTSLDYVRTIGQLYFFERSNRTICLKMMKHFQSFLRNKYHITFTQADKTIENKIALISGIDISMISDIFSQLKWIEDNINLPDHVLIKFHNSLQHFYSTAK